MKKTPKLYSVKVNKHREDDLYGDVITETHEFTRIGVSEKQVESRIRYDFKWYDHDNKDGSVSFRYEFIFDEPEEEKTEKKFEQLNLFDFQEKDEEAKKK